MMTADLSNNRWILENNVQTEFNNNGSLWFRATEIVEFRSRSIKMNRSEKTDQVTFSWVKEISRRGLRRGLKSRINDLLEEIYNPCHEDSGFYFLQL